MNKIYRRLWSTARQCWVVASELAAPRGKAASVCRTAIVATAVLTAPWLTTSAHASGYISCQDQHAAFVDCVPFMGHDDNGRVSTVTLRSGYFLMLGANSHMDGQYSTVFGSRSKSYGNFNALMGWGASAYQGYSTALGAKAEADGLGSVAIGHDSRAFGLNSMAFGSGSKTASGDGHSRIAIGGNAQAGTAGYTGGMAIGGYAFSEYNGVAVGYGARATAYGSVALGHESIANQSNTVSVGKVGSERRIVNVADGNLSETSTDAVNGRQLQSVKDSVSRVANSAYSIASVAKSTADQALRNTGLLVEDKSSGHLRLGPAVGGDTVVVSNKDGATRYLYGVRNGTLSATSTDAVTGQQLYAVSQRLEARSRIMTTGTAVGEAERALATGAGAAAIGQQSVARGTHATALGIQAQATANQATALGRNAIASGVFSTALGNVASASGQSAVALGDRAVASHNGSVALGGQSQTTGTNQVSVGNADMKRRIVNVGNGVLSDSSTDAVTGQQLFATNKNVTAAQTAADTALDSAIALGGLVSQTGADGNLRLGRENSGNVLDVTNKSGAGRRLTGLAEGAINATSTEAVTGKQLQATHDRLATAQSRADAAFANASAAQTTASQAKAKADATGNAVATSGVIEDGKRATASGNVAMAMGQAAKANGTAAFAMGHSAVASGDNAVSLGSASAASARAAVALGGNAKARHENSVALGERSETTGMNEVSVGNAATALKRRIVNVDDARLNETSTDAVTGKQLFATNEKVETNEGVLAGHTRDLTAQSGRIADNRRDLDALRSEFEDFDPDLDGVVKFAADGSVDISGGKLRGVAAGDISSATSSDAVNGGQLFETNRRLDELADASAFLAFGELIDRDPARAGRFGIAIGDSAEASIRSEGAVAIGAYAAARGANSVALGRGAHVHEGAERGFALGPESQVAAAGGLAMGAASVVRASASNAVALGAESIADEANTVSVGNGGLQRRMVNLARGIGSADAATVAQLDDALRTLGAGAGMDGSGNIIAPTYNVQGGTQNNVGDALAALDSAVITADSRVDSLEGKLRSAFQDGPSVRADGLNQLVLAGANGSVLTNLADGRIAAGSRDAVTGSQLFEAKQEIARNRNDLNDLGGGRDGLLSRGLMATEHGNVIDFGGARLTGVADGVISADSRDVVNGRQLFPLQESVRKMQHRDRFFKLGTDEWSEDASAGWFGVAIGESAVASPTGEGGVALGGFAKALGINSVALGRASRVSESATYGQALGMGAHVQADRGLAYGAESRIREGASRSVALGAYSWATEADTVSVGNDWLQRRIVNVANGRNATDAATVGQLRGALATLGGDVDANGSIINPTFNVQGGQQSTLNDALSTLDSAVVTNATRTERVESQLRAVFQDSPSVRSDGLNQLTFAGANGMVLSNVANGAIAAGSRDAVNGGQLHAMQQQLNGRIDGLEQRIDGQPQAPQSRALTVAAAEGTAASSASTATPAADAPTPPPPSSSDNKAVADAGNAPKSSPQPQADAPKPESPKPQVDTAELEKMLARANEYSDGISREVDARLDKMDKRFNRMAAMSSAQSAMAMNTAGLNTYNRLGAGVGYSDGESAMAVGYQRVLNDKGSATFSLNGAFTNSGERSMGVGVGIGW